MATTKGQLKDIQKRLAALERHARYKDRIEVFHPLTPEDKVLMPSQIILYGITYHMDTLHREELEIFNAHFPLILAASSSITRQIQIQRVEAYISAIRVIKGLLHGVAFRGLNPEDNELGFQLIRPQFTHDPETATYRKNWKKRLVAETWTAFIGKNQTTGYAVGEHFGMIITHATSHVRPRPFVTEVQTKVHRTDLVPSPIRSIMIKDTKNRTFVYPLPTLLLVPGDTWFVQLLADVSGTEDLEMGGLVIGLGRALSETVASWK